MNKKKRISNTVFQWFGGKWESAPWIVSNFPPHHTYVSGFGGAASDIFCKDPSLVEVYNDIDGQLVNFFKICREQPEDLASLILLTPYSRKEYEICKSIDEEKNSRLEQARKFTTVARQSRGGIWGKSWSNVITHSRRKMASGNSRWLHLPDSILEIAKVFSTIQIECMNAIDLIKKYDKPNTLFYLDPPYIPETRKKSKDTYRFEMTCKDHEKLLNCILLSSGKFVISGYDNSLYNEKLKKFTKIQRKVPCRSNVNNKGGISDSPSRIEVLWVKK